MATIYCNTMTRKQLLEIASANKDKIRGYSKLTKDNLCRLLQQHGLLDEELFQEEIIVSPKKNIIGIIPPTWDLDHLNPIPEPLLPYWYYYTAGASPQEIVRYFILPQDYPLNTRQNKKGTTPRRTLTTVGEYYRYISNPNTYKGDLEGTSAVNIANLPQGTAFHNKPAPLIGSPDWNLDITNGVVINLDPNILHTQTLLYPQLRYQYQIIQSMK